MSNPKVWYASRVLWFNAVMLVVAVATAVADSQLLTDPHIVTALALTITVGNTILRFLTTQPLTTRRRR